MPSLIDGKASKVSALFCEEDADVTYISSDEITFKIHSMHLNPSTSIGLARSPTSTMSTTGPIDMDECSDVLEILFQFIEPPPRSRNYKHPTISDLDIDLFLRFTEAVEKYVVYGAMGNCLDRLEKLASEYPGEVLNYYILHNREDIGDKAAEYLLSKSTEEIIEKLTAPGLLFRYFIYSHKCWRISQHAATWLGYSKCPRLAMLYKEYRVQLDRDPLSIDQAPANSEANEVACKLCGNFPYHEIRYSKDKLKSIKKEIPKFSAIKAE